MGLPLALPVRDARVDAAADRILQARDILRRRPGAPRREHREQLLRRDQQDADGRVRRAPVRRGRDKGRTREPRLQDEGTPAALDRAGQEKHAPRLRGRRAAHALAPPARHEGRRLAQEDRGRQAARLSRRGGRSHRRHLPAQEDGARRGHRPRRLDLSLRQRAGHTGGLDARAHVGLPPRRHHRADEGEPGEGRRD